MAFCFVKDRGTKCTAAGPPQLQSIGPYPLPPFAMVRVCVLNVLIRYEYLFIIHKYKPRVLSIGHEYSQSSSNEQNSTPCLPQACHYKVNFISHPIRTLSGQELYLLRIACTYDLRMYVVYVIHVLHSYMVFVCFP